MRSVKVERTIDIIVDLSNEKCQGGSPISQLDIPFFDLRPIVLFVPKRFVVRFIDQICRSSTDLVDVGSANTLHSRNFALTTITDLHKLGYRQPEWIGTEGLNRDHGLEPGETQSLRYLPA